MPAKPHYVSAGNVLPGWRDSLFNGTGPTLYRVGAGPLARIELGPGRVVLLGGAPGHGKTALATQWTIDALRYEPTLRAVIANVEMSPAVLFDRQLARLSGVPLDNITKRTLASEHAEYIDRGMMTLESVADRLAFVEPPYTLENIAATADATDATLLVLDYVQRIQPPGKPADSRDRVDSLMDWLRRFADAGRAVLCVSAVARSKTRYGRSTYAGDALSLASFRGSSELEYGADSAYLLVPAGGDSDRVTLRCLKHRHGEPVDIALRFIRELQRFEGETTPDATDAGKLSASVRALWDATPPPDDDSGGGP